MSVCQPLASDAKRLLEAEARTQLALHALQGWQLLFEGAGWRLLKTYPTSNSDGRSDGRHPVQWQGIVLSINGRYTAALSTC